MFQGPFGWAAATAYATVATVALSLATACGASTPEPKGESAEAANGGQAEKPKAAPTPTPETGDTDEAKPAESSDAKPKESNGGEDPTFPEGASVDQATAAVPKGTARSNLDAERLAEPLQAESVYEPCKVGTQHFKVRVAVWAGQAVGVDVTTPNKKLAECIDKQIRGLKWPDKLRSLNTVEFSF
jgi:hypothetical protein